MKLLPLLLLTLSLLAAKAQAQTTPNVVVYVLDDVHHEDLAISAARIGAGVSLTDVVSAVGVNYQRGYSCPTCSPTRYELMTGQLQHRDFVGTALCTNCPMNGINPASTTLPELLACEGWATGLFGKAHYSGGDRTLEEAAGQIHGFETWRAGIAGNLTGGEDHYGWTRIDDSLVRFSTQYTTEAIFEEFEDWWTATDGPKFAVVAPNAPHDPFNAPPASMLPAGYIVGPTQRDRYEAALVAVDLAIVDSARYLDLPNTYVFVIADNGTPFNAVNPNGQERGYKLTVYEGGIRTPFYVFGPGIIAGVDNQCLVQTVDVPATILELLGTGTGNSNGFSDSISFAPTLFGNPGSRTHVFTQRFTPNDGQAANLNIDDWAVIRDDFWKLTSVNGLQRLFKLDNDPTENTPIPTTTAPQVTADLLQLRATTLGPLWPY